MSKKNKKKVGSHKIIDEPENYTSNPYKIIDGFFMDGDVQDGRDDVSRLFEAAFPDDLIVKKHYPSVLVFYIRKN